MSTKRHREDRELTDTVLSLHNLADDLNEISLLLTGKTRDSYFDHEIVAMRAVARTLMFRIGVLEHVAGQTDPAKHDGPF